MFTLSTQEVFERMKSSNILKRKDFAMNLHVSRSMQSKLRTQSSFNLSFACFKDKKKNPL